MPGIYRLSARAVQLIKRDGLFADGGNLYLARKNGGASWLFVYKDRVTGRRREMGLGPVHTVSLQEARQKAEEARKLLWNGGDPIAAKRGQRAALLQQRTFGDYADEFVKSILPGFKNEKHRYQWEQTLRVYATSIRPKLIGDITTADVLAVLEPIWRTKRETAQRLQGRLERVFQAAKVAGLVRDNPASWKDKLKVHFGTKKKAAKHHAAMPYTDLPAFMVELRQRTSLSALALDFTILTAARTGETLGATWQEIDLKQKLWTVPAARMKSGVEHVVPLSARAIAILKALLAGKPSAPVFRNAATGKPFSNLAMLECLRQLRGRTFTVHGFRSAFSDWVGEETHFPRDVREMALAHKIENKTEAAYRRGTALKRRWELMEAWAEYLES